MINIDEQKLSIIRSYWRELCIIALAYTVVFLFRQQTVLVNKIDTMRQEELKRQETQLQKKQEMADYWREAFITTAKYNKYLQQSKDTLQ